jgi:hypothetical protein
MGSHAYARLGYGYDLVGTDGEYKVSQDPEDLPWYDEGIGLVDSAMEVLLKAVGFTEDDYRVDGYFERQDAALEKVGVHFRSYGGYDYSGTLLFAGTSLNVNWIEPVDIPEITDAHRERLAWALKTLGLTPDQEEPRWFLATHYG